MYLQSGAFEESVISPNRTSTCRGCGDTLTLTPISESFRGQFRGIWLHEDEFAANAWESEKNRDHQGMPTHFCMWETGKGIICSKPLRYEDMEALHFGCGVHMRKELERVADADRVRKQKEKQESEDAKAQYEVDQLGLCRARLINLGLTMFDNYKPNYYENRYGRYKTEYRPEHSFKVNVLELEKAIMALLRKELPDEFPCGADEGKKQQLDDLASELFS